jgi:DNA-binding winged helix-turn-helix (wHTH) protein/TolB-like protein/Flp pilus assembly protein TadD
MSAITSAIYEFDQFRIDAKHRFLMRDGEVVQLKPKVFETLLVLIESAGRIVTKDELMQAVWGETIVEENNLTHNISVLRKVLGERRGDHRYILTIPGRGYRFVADVKALTGESSDLVVAKFTHSQILIEDETRIDDSDSRPVGAAVVERSAIYRRFLAAILVIFAILIVSGLTLLYSRSSGSLNPPAPTSEVRKLAVLPFKSIGSDSEDDYLRLGIVDAVIARLSNVKRITVRPTSAVLKYAASEQDPLAAGRELAVDAVLNGSVQKAGDRIRVVVQLVNVREGSALWGETFDEKFADIFTVQDRISEHVANALTLSLSKAERERLTRAETNSPEAYQLYLKGRYYWNKRTQETVKRAIDYFQQAIDRDPNYALAYAGIADSYIILGVYSALPAREAFTKAKAMAERALQLDGSLPEAHTALGYVRFRYEWNWSGAEEEYQRAIELNPNYATAYQWAALNLAAIGRQDEAISQMRRAEELDPVSLIINSNTEWVLYLARRNDEAITHCQKTLDIDPSFFATHKYLGLLYMKKGMYEQAIAEYQKARDLSVDDPHIIALIGHCYALAGKVERARAALRELQELAKRKYVQPYSIAMIYTGLGEKDQALAWLEKAYDDRSSYMVYLKVEPIFDSLHSDPRFVDLIRRVGLPQ